MVAKWALRYFEGKTVDRLRPCTREQLLVKKILVPWVLVHQEAAHKVVETFAWRL